MVNNRAFCHQYQINQIRHIVESTGVLNNNHQTYFTTKNVEQKTGVPVEVPPVLKNRYIQQKMNHIRKQSTLKTKLSD